MKKGLLIVISGPSGVGKGTITKELFKKPELNLFFSVSMTTRSIRPGEVDGVSYYYVSRDEFERNVAAGNLLEHAEFVGNCYGTPADKVEEQRNLGRNVVLEIETNGARQVMSKMKGKGLVSFFILPPSIEELEKRIRGRSTETEEVIQKRLSKAAGEMNIANEYDYSVVNNQVEKAVEEMSSIILERMTEFNA